jgi:hypothetical protein
MFLGSTFAGEQNLVPNGDFSAKDPLKGWRIDFPYQSQYVDNVKYMKVVNKLGRNCLEMDLPPGVAGNQGGKVETALIPCVPGATYRAEVDVLQWDFLAKLHAEAYTTDPRENGQQGTSIFVIPAKDGETSKVMGFRAQFPDIKGSKEWQKATREFTLPMTFKVAGVECKPEFIVIKAVAWAGSMAAGKSYFANFRLYRVK